MLGVVSPKFLSSLPFLVFRTVKSSRDGSGDVDDPTVYSTYFMLPYPVIFRVR